MVKFLFTFLPLIFLRLVAISDISAFSLVFMFTLSPIPNIENETSDPDISDSIRIPQSFLPDTCMSLGHFMSALTFDNRSEVSEAASAAIIFR